MILIDIYHRGKEVALSGTEKDQKQIKLSINQKVNSVDTNNATCFTVIQWTTMYEGALKELFNFLRSDVKYMKYSSQFKNLQTNVSYRLSICHMQ